MTTTINFNATGSRRKELVAAISEITVESKKYLGAPSFAYQVGNYTINREGNVEVDTEPWSLEVLNLIEKLNERGFNSSPIADWPERESTAASDEENADNASQAADVATEEAAAENPSTEENEADTSEENANSSDFQSDSEDGGLTISLPLDGLTETAWSNLSILMAAKRKLIQKALGCDTPIVLQQDGKLTFPWFRKSTPSAEVINAAALLISALVKMAKEQKRITCTEKAVSNEKYAFRCFLLRLGFIGEEYKSARKTLLANFSGSSAFKAGQKNTWYKATMFIAGTDGDAENGMCEPTSYEEMVRAANEEDAMAKANAKAKREEMNASCVNAEPVSDEEYAAWKAEQDAEEAAAC